MTREASKGGVTDVGRVRIGDVDIDGRVSLAPLAGVTDLPFRLLCKSYGASMLTTEMVSAECLVRGHGATFELMRFDDRERPIAVQIWGGEPSVMADAARIVAEETAPDMIDVNFGCPVKKVVGKGAGSACLREPARVGEILSAMTRAVDVPVTAKIRAGWDAPVATEIARVAEDSGASALTIHGRTREQGYSGEADWAVVRDAVEATSRLRIIGNGDVTSAQVAKRRFAETGCHMVMVGRGAVGQPWIFAQIAHFFDTGEDLEEPSEAERVAVAIRHFETAVDVKGEEIAVRAMRSHLNAYLRDLPGYAELRPRLMGAATAAEALSVLREARDAAA